MLASNGARFAIYQPTLAIGIVSAYPMAIGTKMAGSRP
jgi:hypothetical protein